MMNTKLGFLLLIFMLTGGGLARGQRQHNPKDQIQSLNWDIIGNIEFRMTEDDKIFPIYNSTVKRFANQSFTLEGYMVPLKNGFKHSSFLLSTLPINQCYFCGQNGIPIMILVEMQESVRFRFKPVRLRGILKLENKNAAEEPPIILKGAKIMDED